MSIRFYVIRLLVKLLGTKRMTALPVEKLLQRIRRTNQLHRFRLPTDSDFLYRDEMITVVGLDGPERADQPNTGKMLTESFHCLSIRHKAGVAGKKRRAILCVYGGGLLLAPPRLFISFAKKMAGHTGLDVWFPYYPLCDRYSIRDSIRMLAGTYETMCREYEETVWYGYSSGGALLLLLGGYLNEQKSRLPRAKKLVLISPGGIPVSPEEWEAMQEKDGQDVMLSARYMQTIKPLLLQGRQDIPYWMRTCMDADMTGFPETWIYYGTHEVLSVKAEAYDALLTQAGVPHHTKLAPNMPHCYCTTVLFPEARADYEETMRILQSE